MNDTHDQLMKAVIDYLNASETFERAPSERSKRSVRRELRAIIALAKTRQYEIRDTYAEVLADIRASGKWDMNRGKNKNSKKAKE
jgi:acetyl-CoA carboxylase carboxyltransferase component